VLLVVAHLVVCKACSGGAQGGGSDIAAVVVFVAGVGVG
jgi:hypothetical protein